MNALVTGKMQYENIACRNGMLEFPFPLSRLPKGLVTATPAVRHHGLVLRVNLHLGSLKI